MNGRYLSTLLFLIVCGFGSLYLAAEAVLQSFGMSICTSEGCRVVAQYSRFGDLAFVLAGLLAMATLFVLAYQGLRNERAGRDRALNAILIASLAVEGFLVGYQVLWLATTCIFCISVFGIFLVLSVLRVVSGHREVLAGFGALALVLFLFVIILPGGGPRIPKDARLILFYSKECRHCADIRKEIETSGITVDHVLMREYAATLKGLGVEEVPTLLVNGPYEKVFLTGTKAIRQYLASLKPAAAASSADRPAARSSSASGTRRTVAPGPTGPLLLFSLPGATSVNSTPLPDTGLCKEEQKCD